MRDGKTSSMPDQHVDMESDHTTPEKTPQNEQGTIANQNGHIHTKQSTEPVTQTENDQTLEATAHDIEGGSTQHEDDDSIDSISGVGTRDFFLGALLGLLVGPLSLLVIKCWHGMAQHEVRRAKFLLGCSIGIIFQILGFAIAFSAYKLSSRRS